MGIDGMEFGKLVIPEKSRSIPTLFPICITFSATVIRSSDSSDGNLHFFSCYASKLCLLTLSDLNLFKEKKKKFKNITKQMKSKSIYR